MEKNLKSTYLISFFIFSILNLPSIKLIYPLEILNIASTIGLLLCTSYVLVKYDINIKERFLKTKNFTLVFLVLWGMLFIMTYINKPYNIEYVELLKYSLIIVDTMIVVFIADKNNVKQIIFLQLIWSSLLSIYELLFGIQLDILQRQNYLILSLALGAGVVISILLLLYGKQNLKIRMILFLSTILCILAVSSLNGRASILLSLAVPFVIVMYKTITVGSIRTIVSKSILLLGILVITSYIIYANMNDYTAKRIVRIFSFQEEPRFDVYTNAIKAIKENVISGVGLNGFKEFGFNYPHNIFLEIFLAGGIISFVIFSVFTILVARSVMLNVKMGGYALIISGLFIFYFLTWNISFPLSAAYIPFTASALVYISSDKSQL